METKDFLAELEESARRIQGEINRLKAERKQLAQATDEKLPHMTKEEIIAEAMKLPNIPMNLISLLEEQGFRTGSSVFSYVEPNDYDYVICIPPRVFEGYILGSSLDYFNENKFITGYGHVGSRLYNIIFMSDFGLMEAWYMTTQVMHQMLSQTVSLHYISHGEIKMSDVLADKYCRVRIFRALADAFDTKVRGAGKSYQWNNRPKLTLEDAVKYRVCRDCGREAINFTVDKHYKHYLATGTCERCATSCYKNVITQ